jgi:flagellin-like hook-associated protein FlgL
MIVNKSMFPLQTGFGVISKMQDRFADLQVQLGTGMKASTLADMGRDLPLSLSVRSRLSKIEGFSANIDTVNLRLSFLDKTMSRFDKIEGEARNSATQGQYGTNSINMATLPSLSKARLDELVTLLNSDVAGRYLFGGSNTDSAPLPDMDVLLNGQGGKAGFQAVVSERKTADAGVDGRGRLASTHVAATTTVTLAEDGVHPFGLKVSTISSTSGAVTVAQPAPGTLPLGDQVSVTFAPTPAAQIASGETVSMGLTLPDGTETQITLRAVTAAEATGAVGEFVIGADAVATAANFKTSLDAKLVQVGTDTLSAASTFAASQNFFNGPGEPVLRVQGNPATATALRVADSSDTIMWYNGQSPAISAQGLGRLGISTAGDTVTLTEKSPSSAQYGFQISAVSADTANIDTTYTAANPSSVSVAFTAVPAAGESVNVTLAQPDGTTRTVALTAVVGKAGPGQFTIGADENATATNFANALNIVVTEASMAAEGNPRQSVTAQVDDATRVSYGMEANESGFLRLMRTMASMTVEQYPTEESTRATHEPARLAAMALPEGPLRDAALADYEKAITTDTRSAMGRFDAMAIRQQTALSEGHNSELGSIEILTMELGVARGTLDNSTKRHTDYKAQLDNLLSDVETVNKEDVAMEILALQTRLQASYQVTSMVSKLSLVNFI